MLENKIMFTSGIIRISVLGFIWSVLSATPAFSAAPVKAPAPAVAAAPSDWAVKDAAIRFVMDLTVKPSHQSAGYFVAIPNGGSLPGPNPEPVVFDKAGNRLGSAVLWNCPDTELGVVFQSPASGDSVAIYVRGAKQLNLWTPASGITPSAIICERHGTTAREAAHQLGELGAVGSKVRFLNQSRSPAKLDRGSTSMAFQEWRSGGSAMYMLAYVNVKEPGPTWVAPVIRSGQMDIVIDGQPVEKKEKNKKRGGTGGNVNLSAGLHRVEMYGYNPAPGGATGPMMLSWRTPKTTVEELGGLRASDIKYPGTPQCETRLIEEDEVVKSGECAILDIQSIDGGPVAFYTSTANSVFWFKGENGQIGLNFKAWAKNNPSETSYSWSFNNVPGAVAKGTEVNWLLPGGDYSWVTLTAEAGGKKAKFFSSIYPFFDGESSMEDPLTRKAFRLACYNMLTACPDKVDPIAKWDESMWNNFFRVQELQLENPLLEYIVTHHWEFFKKKLDPEKKALIEDLVIYAMAKQKPQEAMKWTMEFSKDTKDRERSVVLQLKRAEILMYNLGDLPTARKVIAPFLTDSSDGKEWARILLGDLEFLSRNINEATQLYGDVQNRAKASSAGNKMLNTMYTEFEENEKGKGKGKGKGKHQGENEARKEAPAAIEAPPPNVAVWKLSAIRDVAASENIGNLIEQGFYLEARAALRAWERAFPLSKISGDFLMREAKLYMAVKDYKRARTILTAYCEQTDVSNFMTQALEMTRDCMYYMHATADELTQFEKEIKKRTQFGGGE